MEKTAIKIVEILQKAGHAAYFAGGSVRDFLMEKEPMDYDIATSAKPDEIEDLLEKTIPIGKEFGVILAVEDEHHFEVATFRSDSSYSDGRRPDAILFTDAKEDAVRRDFTINGLFYDPIKKEVHDFVDGQTDIHDGIVRFIGEAHERIKEDHLRLLRAVRFKNTFGFKYAEKTKAAIKDLAHLVDDISKERIQDELTKMLMHPNRSHAIHELDEFGILERILPEVTDCKGVMQPPEYHGEGDVYTHLLKALHDIPAHDPDPHERKHPKEFASKEVVWATLLHDIGKPGTFESKPDRIHFDGHAPLGAKMAKEICKRLKFSKAETSKIIWLIDNHMAIAPIPDMRRAHQVNWFLHPWFEDLMKVHYADEHGSHPPDLGLYEKIMELYHEFKDEKLLEDHFKPLLKGDEIINEFNLEPGPLIQELLVELRHEQIEGAVKDKKEAMAFVKKYLESR